MAIIYVDSNATGLNDGTSWANAYTTEQAAYTAWATSDEIWIAHNHTESGTVTLTALNDSVANNIPIFRVNSGTNAYSPTTGSDTAQRAAGSTDVTVEVNGDWHGVYWSGIDDLWVWANAHTRKFVDCYIEFGSRCYAGASSSSDAVNIFSNCTINLSGTNTARFILYGGVLIFNGCTFTGSQATAGLLQANNARGITVLFRGCDLSALTTNPMVDMSTFSDYSNVDISFINCDLPSGYTISDGTFGNDGQAVSVINSGAAGELYNNSRETYRGDLVTSTSCYLTAGYADADGPTNLSINMQPSSVCAIASPMKSFDMVARIETTGTKTFTVQLVEDYTTALTQRECWLEVFCLGSATESLQTLEHSREVVATSYTNLAAGDGLAAWTGEPAGSRSVEVSVTASVNQAGLYAARLMVSKYEATKSVYYNPQVTVT